MPKTKIAELGTVLNLTLKDSDIASMKSAISDSKKIKSIKVGIEATHAGIVNKNYKFYLPAGMSNGADSFVKPYNKPVTVNHDPAAPPIGRVIDAKYVSYNIKTDVNTLNPSSNAKFLDKVQKFISSDSYSEAGYKGLGHIYLTAEISDEVAIERIMDKRYMTVSIGGGSNHMYCSVCGVDNKDNYCEHYPGQKYEDQTCYFISGDIMDFDHVSYVNSPADMNTTSEILDSSDQLKITILDYVLEDKKDTQPMTFLDFLKSTYGSYEDFKKYMEGKKLSKSINEDGFTNAKESQFLIAEGKILPVFDKAHAVASLMILNDSTDTSDDRKVMIQTVEDLLNTLYDGKFVIEDALKELDDKEENTPVAKVEPVAADNLKVVLSEDQIAGIIAGVTKSLKEAFNVSDSFSAQRIKALQKENINLEKEVQGLSDKYRKGIINQILALEDKVSDAEYNTVLNTRNILSLEDKLSDLGQKKTVDTQTNSNDNNSKQLDPNSVTITDAAKVEGEDGTPPVADPKNVVEKTSTEEIIDTYKNLVREKGLYAAKQYIKGLQDENKIPENFTFHGAN